ncbi:MAG: nucleotidyltransferase family protein [Leptospiraceae bacterium]|nr:nucleotidyltransferase family protein [Leptospiraceae bacterium]
MNISDLKSQWKKVILPLNSTIKEAVINLSESGYKIVIISENDKFIGTITDGDIRRGLLKGLTLEESITKIVHTEAIVVPPTLPKAVAHDLMKANKVMQLPIVNEERNIVGLYLWDEIDNNKVSELENIFLIMAGGKGIRLRPITENCPKPMVTVAGKPIIEHIIIRAKENGFNNFFISIHYLGHMIEDFFKGEKWFGTDVKFLREEIPLGTAGAIGLLGENFKLPILVTNGDLLTDINYNDVIKFHSRNNADVTMVVRSFEWQHPYGVVEMNGLDIKQIIEKPVYKTYVNAGIYVINPICRKYIKNNEYLDMTLFLDRLKEAGLRVIGYPMHEPWMDVGRHSDLELANQIFL